MKQTILLMAIMFALVSCSNKTASISNAKNDTARTLLAYRLPDSTFHIELGWRITREVNQFVLTDSNNAKKQLTRDSIYLVPNPDSAKVGKLLWAFCPKELILIDGGKNIDSLFKKYGLHIPKVPQDDSIAIADFKKLKKLGLVKVIKNPNS